MLTQNERNLIEAAKELGFKMPALSPYPLETWYAEAVEFLEAARCPGGCFCNAGLAMDDGSNPSHTDECKTATAAIDAVFQERSWR